MPQTISAIGVGVTPGNLNFSVQAGSSDTGILYVINTGSEVSNYRVYVDEDYVDWFDISHEIFNLDAGENQAVTFTIRPPPLAKGDVDLTAYVVSSSPDSDFSVGSGIKVPVHATVSNSGVKTVILLALVIAGLGILLFIRKKKRDTIL